MIIEEGSYLEHFGVKGMKWGVRAAEIAAMRASMAETVRSANADLRARDNDLGIPFNQRTYLTEWD